MRIEDRPTRHDSQKGIVIVLVFTVILICLYALIRTLATPIEDLPYGMHPEPITVFEEEVVMDEIITEEVEFAQEVELSDDDILARVAMAEAGTEPLLGKVAVVVTVLNRSNAWGRSVLSVVTEKNQYAYPYYGIIDEECYRAVEIAEKAIDAGVFPEDMFYFRTKHYHKFGEPYIQIGAHFFSCEGSDDGED